MKASSIAGTCARRVGLVAVLAAVVATATGSPAGAQQVGLPIPESSAWKQYVLGDGAPDATPVRVVSTSGDVSNAQGLVHESKKPTALTYTAGRAAPTIVLDYGREVGGLPFFDVDHVTPASGASPVSLRAAYSETLQFLWSYGSSTLSVAAAVGDTNIKVGSVANFVVGGELKWLADPAGSRLLHEVVGTDDAGRPRGILGDDELRSVVGSFPISALAAFPSSGLDQGIVDRLLRRLRSAAASPAVSRRSPAVRRTPRP